MVRLLLGRLCLFFISHFLLKPCIVCDNGTGFVKVGYAGQNFPASIFPSMIGRPVLRAEESLSEAVELKDIMCGDEAAKARQYLDIKYPVRLNSHFICIIVNNINRVFLQYRLRTVLFATGKIWNICGTIPSLINSLLLQRTTRSC